MQKYGFLILMLCICITLCGCSKAVDNNSDYSENPNSTTSDKEYTMHILYNETDSFNPYAATTKENRELCHLLYDPLITLGSDFEPILKIAQSATVEGKVCTVSLNNVLFSDGTRLTANDVLYSANLAMSSSTVYSKQLNEVESINIINNNIVFNLKKADPFFVNLLDFPIIKANSENLKSEDNVILPPIGAGRYVLNEKNDALTPNSNYYGKPCTIKNIKLINAPGKESIDHYVSAGVVSLCYSDYSDNTIPRMSGLKVDVPLNNMVFIGVNMSHWLLKEPYLRYAISSVIDRTEIVKEAYYGNGTVANGPFNPLWKHSEGFQTLEAKGNTQISVENLEKIGYNNLDNEGYRVNSSKKRISISLLVNSDNAARVSTGNLIVERLESVGIKASLVAVDFETYISRLQSGNFDIYLGEVKLLGNMDISPLVTPNSSAAYGIVDYSLPIDTETTEGTDTTAENVATQNTSAINLTALNAAKGYYNGIYTLGDVASAFLSEMPIIPIMYRSGIAMFTPDIKGVPNVSVSDLFIDINNYSFKN